MHPERNAKHSADLATTGGGRGRGGEGQEYPTSLSYISQPPLVSATDHKPGDLCTKPGRWTLVQAWLARIVGKALWLDRHQDDAG